ncbi:hypothetical protein PAXINDRAFT_8717 [Paxillus involutus ATCC 200175]|nr:hypothetical protein PAXINDRAFT_8717 [Paxillus involutus ATCC 200175]
MDHKAKAKVAWQRSMEVNPSQWPAQLLLGLESINASKLGNKTEQERAQAFLIGTKHIEKAFNANQKSAAAANALCELTFRVSLFVKALKLAERTIQFADTLTLLTEGNLRAARALHAEGSLSEATKYYTIATEGQPKHVLGAIGMAPMQIQHDEVAAAIHTFDTLIQPPNAQRSVEATIMLASQRVQCRCCARKRLKLANCSIGSANFSISRTRGSTDMHTRRVDQRASLPTTWTCILKENVDRTTKAFRDAVRISEANGLADPRLLNNLGALQHMEDNLAEAWTMYEDALTKATTLSADDGKAMSTSILYNLARVYEDDGERGV